MELLLTFILAEVIVGVNLGIVYLVFHKRLSSFEKGLYSINKRIDSIFVVDQPTPNEASKEGNGFVDLNEQNIIEPPEIDKLKLEVEGGDEQTPPGYPVKK